MGAWGTKLYQDDVAKDVREEMIDLLRCGKKIEDATKELLEKNTYLINDEEDGPVFWLALADTQWEIGRLLPFVKEKAIDIIKNGENLNNWKGPSNKDHYLRKQVLVELLVKLNSPVPIEKIIPKYTLFKTNWKPGDTFAFKLESEYAKEKGLYGRYLILYTLYNFLYPKGDSGDIYPVIYIKITKDDNIPKDSSEINQLDFIKISHFAKINKYYYRVGIRAKSKKTLNKFTYIGNIKISAPSDEQTVIHINQKIYDIYIDDYVGERIEGTTYFDFSDKHVKEIIDKYFLFG